MQLIIHLECITDKQLFLYCRQLIKHYSCNTGCLITIILLIAVLKNLVNFIKILLCSVKWNKNKSSSFVDFIYKAEQYKHCMYILQITKRDLSKSVKY